MTDRTFMRIAWVAAGFFVLFALMTTSVRAACLCPPMVKYCNAALYCAGDMKHLHLGWLEDAIPYIIAVDTGGYLTEYESRYKKLGDKQIMIDGECGSACTLVLASPKVCSTSRGYFVFHAAYEARDHSITSRDGTAYLWSKYPQKVRDWITANGGLTSTIIKAWGQQFVPKCPV